LSKKGYNAFALIYRPGAQTACEDLARAIAFLHENAEKLQIDMTDYSLWGGSAGARMAAWLGSYGTAYFGEKEYPAPAAVIMQYTGLSQVTGMEPPTYACVGTSDGIASYRSMEKYISQIQQNGPNTKIEVFKGLSHGFGLGEGTVAEGWIGMAMLVLFISHHILNHKWVTSVRKGKYNAFRVIQTVLVIIMLILIMGSMISGILLSNHIFKWIKISGTYMTARQIHMFCAYWGLVVMSLHLGFHWNIAVAMAGRLWEHPSVIRTWAARSVATTIAGYGLYAFYRRQIGDYLIMRMHFVFYDYEKGIFPFLLDYLAVMMLIAFIGYYSGVFLKKTGKRKRKGSY